MLIFLLVGGLGRRASDGGANVQTTYYKRQVIPGQQGQSPNKERPATVRYFYAYLIILCL